MRAGLLSLLLLALLALSALHASAEEVAVADDGELLIEEELGASGESQQEQEAPQMDPRLTAEAFEVIVSKLTSKCRQQIEANPVDPSEVSERCRAEVGHKMQRYLARLDREEQKLQSGEAESEPQQQKPKKPRTKKTKKASKKQARAAREAAEARKKDEEYQQTLQIILGFVATVLAAVAGFIFFVTSKLKAAGMYYPADPDAKANCCD